jgi:hypothetical protein
LKANQYLITLSGDSAFTGILLVVAYKQSLVRFF